MKLANFLFKNFDQKFKQTKFEGGELLIYRKEVCDQLQQVFGQCPPYYENYREFKSKVFKTRKSLENFKKERSKCSSQRSEISKQTQPN